MACNNYITKNLKTLLQNNIVYITVKHDSVWLQKYQPPLKLQYLHYSSQSAFKSSHNICRFSTQKFLFYVAKKMLPLLMKTLVFIISLAVIGKFSTYLLSKIQLQCRMTWLKADSQTGCSTNLMNRIDSTILYLFSPLCQNHKDTDCYNVFSN